MAKEVTSQVLTDIREAVEAGNAVIGTEQTVKNLKQGKATRVFVTSNCDDIVLKDIERLAEISEVEVVKLDIPNDELSVLCKKPYSISVLSLENKE